MHKHRQDVVPSITAFVLLIVRREVLVDHTDERGKNGCADEDARCQ